MSKALWKGQLSLGLVHIPIRLYPETRPRDPAFTLVDRRDLAPIGVTRVNKRTGEPVPSSEIARAATLASGEAVIVPDQVLDELVGLGTRAIRIAQFTPIQDISPAQFQSPYFLEPTPEGEKGYAILLEAMKRTKKAAIARIVLLHREKLSVLWADHSMLMMSVLRWPAELRRPQRLARELPAPQEAGVGPEEIDAALRLVEAMSIPWDPHEFRDESRERVRAWFERKAGAAVVREIPAMTPPGLLLNFLERSVKSAKEQPRKGRPTRSA
jgi:DNA end-binding protein Ku